ncbi:MAG: hypothetical protein QM765_17395 [Myxococcales bacterium]
MAADSPPRRPASRFTRALVAGLSLTLALALMAADARAEPEDAPALSPPRTRDCLLNLLGFCLVDSEIRPATPTRFRLESALGLKVANFYYGHETNGCRGRGCSLDFTGVSGTLELSYNLAGNPHSDDYWDLGVAAAYMPVVSVRHNPEGFRGQFGDIAAGDGELGYLSFRVSLRRPSLFNLITSKYLFTAVGVGVAVPVYSSETGRSFTGGSEPHLTIGGKVGIQGPIAEHVQLGFCAHWNVMWAGRDALDFVILSAYGLHLSTQF